MYLAIKLEVLRSPVLNRFSVSPARVGRFEEVVFSSPEEKGTACFVVAWKDHVALRPPL